MDMDDFSKLTFLVVDDNEFMRNVARRVLQTLRARKVLEAATAAEALEMTTLGHVDVVLCDYEMKPESGLEFVRKLRKLPDEKKARTPVIMVTGHSDEDLVLRAREAGIDGYVVKPYSAQSLADRIDSVVRYPARAAAPSA